MFNVHTSFVLSLSQYSFPWKYICINKSFTLFIFQFGTFYFQLRFETVFSQARLFLTSLNVILCEQQLGIFRYIYIYIWIGNSYLSFCRSLFFSLIQAEFVERKINRNRVRFSRGKLRTENLLWIQIKMFSVETWDEIYCTHWTVCKWLGVCNFRWFIFQIIAMKHRRNDIRIKIEWVNLRKEIGTKNLIIKLIVLHTNTA